HRPVKGSSQVVSPPSSSPGEPAAPADPTLSFRPPAPPSPTGSLGPLSAVPPLAVPPLGVVPPEPSGAPPPVSADRALPVANAPLASSFEPQASAGQRTERSTEQCHAGPGGDAHA